MKYILYIISIIFLVGINVGFFPYFKLWGVVPNLLFLFVVVASLEKNSYDFYLVAFLAGLFLDFYTAVFLGSFTLAFIILGFLLHQLVHNVVTYEINWKYMLGILLLCLAAVDIFLWSYNSMAFKLGWSSDFISFRLLEIKFFPEFFYDLLLLYPVKWLLESLKFINGKYFSRQRVM